MNHSYRLVWNDASQRYVAVPETARGRGKGRAAKTLAPAAALLGALLALPAWGQAPPAHALPTGGQVVVGSAGIAQSGSQMNIQQDSQKAVLQWQGFDIGSAASVRFHQPDASAVALNRVVAGNASQIHGQLSANGQVWLVNPNGVVFGQGSRVNVGGLVASTLDTSNDDFLAGKAQFTRGSAAQGGITNQGEITATGDGQGGGLVALLAPSVKNEGVIRAQLGNVVLAGGDRVGLQAGANGFLQVALEPSTVKTLIENKQLIMADGGQVLMTGRAADALSASVVANSGTVQARTLAQKNGRILLLADMQHGEAQAAGTLQANSVETSAASVHIDSQLKVLTDGGRWLIDPVDITIDQGKATAIAAALGDGDVTVATSSGGWGGGFHKGDIQVNADISFAKYKLTLNADNQLNINARIAVNGDGTLALNYGGTAGDHKSVPVPGSNLNVSGQVDFAKAGTDLLSVNGHGYTVINSLDALQKMKDGLDGKYALGGSVDASATAGWNNLQGFAPIGNGAAAFTGTFDGLGHVIKGLTINRPSEDYVGLFGLAQNATLRNVGLVGGSIQGGSYVGGLVGQNIAVNGGTTSISNAYASGPVWGTNHVGGLVGENRADNGGTASISNAYATGQVSGANDVGGLVGQNIAYNGGWASISNAYATGRVSGASYVGGLVGSNQVFSGAIGISNVYAAGQVSGTGSYVGGLVGLTSGGSGGNKITLLNIYWDSDSTGVGGASGGPAEIDSSTRYRHISYEKLGNWTETAEGSGVWQAKDASGVVQWIMFEGSTRPFLASEYSTSIRNDHQLQLMGYKPGASYTLANDIDASATEVTELKAPSHSGMWGTQGFDPVGNQFANFTGTFDGQGHTINGLTTNRPDQDGVGLFGYARNATLRNVGLVGGSVTGKDHVGMLVGYNLAGDGTASITNAYAAGEVTGHWMVGGLVGSHGTSAGGQASISNAYATGSVKGASAVGGLVGFSVASKNGDTRIANVYATGPVTGDDSVGGLVGVGMVGEGGLVSLSNAYATGKVTGTSKLGGLLGAEAGVAIERSFYAITDTAGAQINPSQADGSFNTIGEGKTLADLQKQSTFEGWNIDDQGGTGLTWRIYEGSTTPLLRSFLKQLTVSTSGIAGKTYDGSHASGTATYGEVPAAVKGGASLNYATTGKNAGTYSVALGTLKVGGLYSDQQGYDISYSGGGEGLSLSIDKAMLSVTGTTVDGKTYDGNTKAEAHVGKLQGLVGDERLDVNVTSSSFDDRNAGERMVTVGYRLADGGNGGLASNYTVVDSHHSASIDKATLTLAAVTDSKTYDGSSASNVEVQVSGLVNGDRITGLGQSFDSRNAGSRGLQVNAGYAIEDGNGGGNYEVTTRGSEGRIDPRALTIAAHDAHKLSGQALGFDGTEFSTNDGGLVPGETVQSVTLASAGSAAHAGAGSYAIAASNVQGGNGFDAGNYDIRYVDGSLSVMPPVSPPVTPSATPPVHSSTKLPFTSFAAVPSLVSLAGDAWCTGQALRQKAREEEECSLTAGHVPMLQLAPEFVRRR